MDRGLGNPMAVDDSSFDNHPKIDLINSFCEITTCPSKSQAFFFLESHNFNLDAAVFTYLETIAADADPPPPPVNNTQVQSSDDSPSYSPLESDADSPPPSRSRSPSPTPAARSYNLRGRNADAPAAAGGGSSRMSGGSGGVRTLADLNRAPQPGGGSDGDPDFDPQEYYTGGERSGMLVQDRSKENDVDAIFNQATQSGGVERTAEQLQQSRSSRNFTGTARLLSGEAIPSMPQQPEIVTHNIAFWRNGFTVNDGRLRRLDDPQNASFLESIRRSECPEELAPADRRTAVHVNLTRKEEDCPERRTRQLPFQGVGRTLGSTSETALAESGAAETTLITAPVPFQGLVVDETQPSTSIQLRLSDGTRMVSRFNYHHTIRDIRSFIDASRPGGSRNYQLQTVGFPPKQLTDLDETIEQAGLANSVVIQKLS